MAKDDGFRPCSSSIPLGLGAFSPPAFFASGVGTGGRERKTEKSNRRIKMVY